MSDKPKVIVFIETSHSYGRGLLKGISKYSRIHGPWDFFRPEPFYHRTSHKKAFLKGLSKLDASGIIMREPTENPELLELNLPTIVSPYTTLTFPGYPNIVADNMRIGQLAAEHLLSKGFKHFAYCGFPDMPWSRARGQGFVRRIAAAGLTSSVYELPASRGRCTWDREQFIVADWLASLPKPVGIMTCTDDRSQNVNQACKIVDLHVPEQVAIVGVDNDPINCDLSDPPLSSVLLNVEKAGYEAAALLDKLMSGQTTSEQTILVEPLLVVERQSTDVLAVDDSQVAKAIYFIRDHSQSPLSIDQVVREVSLCRRTLEVRFRQALGCSIYKEIIQARIDRVVRMLIETDASISEIVDTLQFGSMENLCRAFKREMAQTPSAYRKKYQLK